MNYNIVKKYKFNVKDLINDVKYTIYTNTKLTKKEKINCIRQYIISVGKIPPAGSCINIISDK